MSFHYIKTIVALFLVIILLSTPPVWAEEATQENTSWSDWLREHTLYNGQVLPLVNLQCPSMASDNPENDFKKIERYSYEAHIRPDLSLEAEPLRFGLSPRLIAAYHQFHDGTQEGEEDSEAEVFLREGYLKWRMSPALRLGLERKNLQWGSGFLTSPSNPFYQETGRSRPYRELGGKDFVWLEYVSNDWLALIAYANIGEGEFESRETFHNVYAFKGELTFESVFFSPIIAYKDEDRIQIGGYGTWTASDALVLFFDCAMTQGWNGRYPESTPDDPFGLVFRETKDDSRGSIPQILLGGSYTFLSGTAVSLEYLHYGPGYSDAEANRYYDMLNSSAEAYQYQGENPQLQLLAQLAARNLGQAALNRLAFQRKNYLMAYLTRSDWFDRLDVTAGGVLNLDDRSWYLFGSFDVKFKDTVRLFANSLVYSKKQDTEFEANLDYSQTIGLKLYF